jgi:multisubunit Na+/H+ antiporter MnhB subunit
MDDRHDRHGLSAATLAGLILAAGVALVLGIVLLGSPPAISPAATAPTGPALAPAVEFASVLWDSRAMDLLGQALVLFAGALGVLVLFRGEGRV